MWDDLVPLSLSLSLISIDPVTGGPSKPVESPLDHMTPEEIELEAEKLGTLFNQLQE